MAVQMMQARIEGMSDKVILYVEDNRDDARLTELMFQRLKVRHTLHVVSNAREAMERLRNTGKFADGSVYPLPEIILLDVRLPESNGFEILSLIRQEAALRGIPVFFLTESPVPEHEAQALKLGATGYIKKIVSVREFADII